MATPGKRICPQKRYKARREDSQQASLNDTHGMQMLLSGSASTRKVGTGDVGRGVPVWWYHPTALRMRISQHIRLRCM